MVIARALAALVLATLTLPAAPGGDIRESARRLSVAKNWPALVTLIEEHYQTETATGTLDELLAVALLNLGRKDEAAHYFDRAIERLADDEPSREDKRLDGQDPDAEIVRLRKRRDGLDPLAASREKLLTGVAKDLLGSATKLADEGHAERALEYLQRIQPAAHGAGLAAVNTLLDKLRASTERVNLSVKGAGPRPSNGWPEFTFEGAHYTIDANLEPAIVETLGRTMDEIFDYYTRIYFDGVASAVAQRKVTLRIWPRQVDMFAGGPPKPGVGGWWNAGDWAVTAYDTRSDPPGREEGDRLEMLEVLFHEASHHFMEMRAKGPTPAWLNEGTASFFEGAIAMADGRVLWPDASRLRLKEFDALSKGGGHGVKVPTLADVLEYNEPGSYGGEYYAFGWALVYFLQQYEDPQTLEYVYRPLYARYRDEIIAKHGNPRELFEQVFLGANSPLHHKTLEEFDTFWRRYIGTDVWGRYYGANRRALRLGDIARYVDAAPPAVIDKKTKKPVVDPTRKVKVPEQELLLRALGGIEFVRTKIDDPEQPDPKLLLQQADVLERLGRSSSAAPIVERLLELREAGGWAEATDEQVKRLEKRLGELDQKNAALRIARSKSKGFVKRAGLLLDEYAKASPALTLRSYTFALVAATALDDPKGLGARAEELRTKAREAGLLKGATYRVTGENSDWATMFAKPETVFESTREHIELATEYYSARLCKLIPVSGEYEYRARITRRGEAKTGQQHGLVFSGTERDDWMAVSIDKSGKLVLRRMARGRSGGATDEGLETVNLKTPPEMGKPFDLKVHVFPSGDIEVTVGSEGPFPLHLPQALPSKGHVGVYVKNGSALFENALVEIVP